MFFELILKILVTSRWISRVLVIISSEEKHSLEQNNNNQQQHDKKLSIISAKRSDESLSLSQVLVPWAWNSSYHEAKEREANQSYLTGPVRRASRQAIWIIMASEETTQAFKKRIYEVEFWNDFVL